MARKSVSRGPDRPAHLALAEPPSARSTALDQATSRGGVDDLDRRSSDDAELSSEFTRIPWDSASGTSHVSTLRWGYALVFGSASVLAVGLWSILIGPLCEPTGIQSLDILVQDDYYKYLVILLVPVTVCFVIINWWGLKIFRHA